ncbi:MAG: chemotaxis protein CheW [Proteobacteria bacterium]|nr:chemotaxis protein CheW [Pseudomonadota bacterium]
MKVRGEDQWVVFKLGAGLYGVEINFVQEMTRLIKINHVPNVPPHVLGTMLLRDRVVPVTDLRLRLGLPSQDDERRELVDMLTLREEDHLKWLGTLETAVREKMEFALTRDPHKCAFGRWYDQFETSDLLLESQLRKFDDPHRRIHALADEVLSLEAEGREGEALKRLAWAEEHLLKVLVNLFQNTRQMIMDRQTRICVIMERGGRLVGLVVDEILGVNRIPAGDTEDLPELASEARGGFIKGVARTDGGGSRLVLLLDAARLLNDAEQAAT